MVPIRMELSQRYKLGSTIESISFCINDQGKIFEFRGTLFDSSLISSDTRGSKQASRKILEAKDYVTCIYGDYCWLALVCEVSHDCIDVYCKFMHPRGYTVIGLLGTVKCMSHIARFF